MKKGIVNRPKLNTIPLFNFITRTKLYRDPTLYRAHTLKRGVNKMRVVPVSDTLSQVSVTVNGVCESAIAPHDQILAVAFEILKELQSQ